MQAARGASLNSSDNTDPQTIPSSQSRRRYLWLFAVIAASAYALDVVTKSLALEYLRGEPRLPLLGDVLSLYLTYNSGAAFSFLTGQTPCSRSWRSWPLSWSSGWHGVSGAQAGRSAWGSCSAAWRAT